MPQKFKRTLAKYYFILRPLSAIIIGGLLIFLTIKAVPMVKKSVIFQVLFNREIVLKKADHRINLLILGIAGGDHAGADLTDTIIFVSIDPNKKDVLIISVPRDIWIDSMRAKINTAFHYGEEKKEGGGFILAKAAINEIFDQTIDYVVKIDFTGFKKAIDLIGGIDIEVEKSFIDKKYPIEGRENDDCGGNDPDFKCRYQSVSFKKGRQHLNGETALQFVRSRYAEGEEGTDFARSKRQQKIILAIKEKIFSVSTLLNPVKIKGLIDILGESVVSDIKKEEIDDFIRLVKDLKNTNIRTFILDEGDELNGKPGLLVNPPVEDYDGTWVLVPRSGDWQKIQKKIKKEMMI